MPIATSMPRIVIDATPDSDFHRRCEVALRLADRHGSSIHAVCTAWPDDPKLLEAFAAPIPFLEEQRLREAIATAHIDFEQLVAGSPITPQWCGDTRHPDAALADHALFADLMIMGSSPPFDHVHADPVKVAARTGTPVLRLGTASEASTFSDILVAWKESREAHCAVRAALPILRKARRVVLLAIGADQPRERLSEVRDHLAARGVEADWQHQDAEGASPGGFLLDFARREGCHVIVAGARAHGGWKEKIFGGVTRDLLACREISWLLAN